MNLTDPVADFLTRIRNSIRARHQKLDVPASKLKAEIARILKEEGTSRTTRPLKKTAKRSSARSSSTAQTTKPLSANSSCLTSWLPCIPPPRRSVAFRGPGSPS